MKKRDNHNFAPIKKCPLEERELVGGSSPDSIPLYLSRQSPAKQLLRIETIESYAKQVMIDAKERGDEYAEGLARHCLETTERLPALRQISQRGDRYVKMAMELAFDAGVAAERLRCYLEAPAVVQVRKMETERAKYNQETRQAAVARFTELRAEYPERKIGPIEKQVSEELGIPVRSLQRWRKNV